MNSSKIKETILHIMFAVCACVSILAVITICVYLFASGIPAIAEIGVGDFLFGTKWKPSSGYFGILPMIVGSILVTGIAKLIGVPLGVLCAVFMSHCCPKSLYRFVKPAVNLLAGIPSIVYGLFGFLMFVIGFKWRYSMLEGVITLAIMVLPLIIRTTEEALLAVPDSFREGSLGLGAGKSRTVFRVVLPAAIPGIMSGIVLAIGRIVGESAALHGGTVCVASTEGCGTTITVSLPKQACAGE